MEVSLLLCGDETIRELNRDYREKDRPTDVLSFPQEEGPAMPLGMAEDEIPHMLGDIVISVDTARRQAEEHGWSVQDEVEALFAHSLLHLLGYDHETPGEKAVMRARENELLGEKSVWRNNREETEEADDGESVDSAAGESPQ